MSGPTGPTGEPWYCERCGYALLDEPNWNKHREWHRREQERAKYAEIDAEIDAERRDLDE